MTPATLQLVTLHKQWLDHAVTKQLSNILDKHRETVVLALAGESSAVSKESDRRLHQLATQLKTVDTIKKLIYDTDLFVNMLTK